MGKDDILKVIKSDEFRSDLCLINENFSNLKQEHFIRNSIIIHFNKMFGGDKRAVAEHPREGNRIDLSIYDKVIDNLYLVELKFQFPGDYKCMSDFKRVIDDQFQRKINDYGIDAFILIVHEWDTKKMEDYNEPRKIPSALSKYQIKGIDTEKKAWQKNIEQTLIEAQACLSINWEKFCIPISEPYNSKYHFFILYRNKIA